MLYVLGRDSSLLRNLRLLSAVLLLGVMLCSCGGSEDEGPTDSNQTEPDSIPNIAPVDQPTALTCPTGSALTYNNFGAAFMAKYCTTCHSKNLTEAARNGAPLATNFDTATDIALWRSDILTATGTGVVTATKEGAAAPSASATMPPGGAISATDRASLAEWLGCGAPAGRRRGG